MPGAEEAERNLHRSAPAQTHGNVTQAARHAPQDHVTWDEVPGTANPGDMIQVASWRAALNQRIVLSILVVTGWAAGIQLVAAAPNRPTDLAQVRESLAALPVQFVPNAGQWDSRAAFAAHTFAGTLFVTTG